MARAAALLALFLAVAANAQTIVWNKFDPIAVRTNRTADVPLAAQTSGTVSGMRLDHANDGSLVLTQSTPGHWVASVPAAKVLDGYAADDVNHNFVGFIRLLASDGSTIRTLGGKAGRTRSLTDANEDLDATAVSEACWPLCLADRRFPRLG